ncbi:MAG: AAA family ATPase, partial [Clostridia bacterium]|nr:AAA family ATPase [Clostridia bacterium]
FCGSDYDDNSFWNVGYPESELYIFERDGISSTKIRENPYKNWDMLPALVRPYYNKKVLLIGGESTGKSTLTINLAHYYNTNYIDEAGRDISERSGTDSLMLTEDFSEILLQQKLNEIKAIAHSNKVLFIDTDSLITQFYMNFLEDPGKEKNIALSDAVDAINDYDLILFFEPDVAFVQDGGRSEVIRDNRFKYSNMIKALLDSHGRDYVVIGGDYQERFLKAVEQVNKILNM